MAQSLPNLHLPCLQIYMEMWLFCIEDECCWLPLCKDIRESNVLQWLPFLNFDVYFFICSSFQFGATPLHLASKAGHIEIVRCLLLAGSNADLKNKVSFSFSQATREVFKLFYADSPDLVTSHNRTSMNKCNWDFFCFFKDFSLNRYSVLPWIWFFIFD